MTDESEETREQGVEFGSLSTKLDRQSYPMTGEELLDKFGDYTLELEGGEMTVREILQIENEREFEDSESVRQSIFSMVDSEAIGRDAYSDRGGATPDDDTDEDAESL